MQRPLLPGPLINQTADLPNYYDIEAKTNYIVFDKIIIKYNYCFVTIPFICGMPVSLYCWLHHF